MCVHSLHILHGFPGSIWLATDGALDQVNLILIPQSSFCLLSTFSRLTDVVRCVTGKKVPKDCRLLVFGMVCEDEEEDDALPPIHVCLQPMSSSE